jgi:hypothetical protein
MESIRKPPERERRAPETTKEEPPSEAAPEKSQPADAGSGIRRVTEGGPTAYVFTGMSGPKKPAPADKPKRPR